MFRKRTGRVARDDPTALAYLRPETAQGIFINFLNVQTTMRRKIAVWIAQVGKSFATSNAGNFILRTREFEQMEMEYFVSRRRTLEARGLWVELYLEWFKALGIDRENLNLYEVPRRELAHYSKRTVDIMYSYFPEREKRSGKS
jgi:glycyl-tRNA synthetase